MDHRSTGCSSFTTSVSKDPKCSRVGHLKLLYQESLSWFYVDTLYLSTWTLIVSSCYVLSASSLLGALVWLRQSRLALEQHFNRSAQTSHIPKYFCVRTSRSPRCKTWALKLRPQPFCFPRQDLEPEPLFWGISEDQTSRRSKRNDFDRSSGTNYKWWCKRCFVEYMIDLPDGTLQQGSSLLLSILTMFWRLRCGPIGLLFVSTGVQVPKCEVYTQSHNHDSSYRSHIYSMFEDFAPLGYSWGMVAMLFGVTTHRRGRRHLEWTYPFLTVLQQ